MSWSNVVSVPRRWAAEHPCDALKEIEDYFDRFRRNVHDHYGVRLGNDYTETRGVARTMDDGTEMVDIRRTYEEAE